MALSLTPGTSTVYVLYCSIPFNSGIKAIYSIVHYTGYLSCLCALSFHSIVELKLYIAVFLTPGTTPVYVLYRSIP